MSPHGRILLFWCTRVFRMNISAACIRAIKVFLPIMNMQWQTGTSYTCWRTLLLCQKKKTLLPPHQGLLFMLVEKLPHAVSGNTRDDRGMPQKIFKKKKKRRREEKRQSTAAVNIGRVIFVFFSVVENKFGAVLESP